MTKNATYCDKHVSSRKCIFFVVLVPMLGLLGNVTENKKGGLLWQTCIITEVYFFVVTFMDIKRDGCLSSTAPDQDPFIASSRFNDAFVHFAIAAHYKKNTLPWWYVFVIVGLVFCHACTSMTNLWQNQDSHTSDVIEVFHDIAKIIIMEVSTSMTINHTSQKCFRQGWPTRGSHGNGMPLSYRVGFWIR